MQSEEIAKLRGYPFNLRLACINYFLKLATVCLQATLVKTCGNK